MADDLPPASAESADDAAKAETIRITLPAKPETPTAKRETVRINLPGKAPVSGVIPKKETTKIVTEAATLAAAIPSPPSAPSVPSVPSIPAPTQAPGVARPFLPPPRLPTASGASAPPPRPVSGITAPPKPPTLGRPGIPLKPGAPPSGVMPAVPSAPKPGVPSGSGTQPAPEPMLQKAAAPKKETARITLPAEGAKPSLPKATVKMQQTQPLVRQPSASTIQAVPVIQTTPASISRSPASDGFMNVLAIVAFIVSIGAAVLAFLAYSAAQLS